MSLAPKTDIGKATAAFVTKKISRRDYIACLQGDAYVSGAFLYKFSHYLKGKPRFTMHPLKTPNLNPERNDQ